MFFLIKPMYHNNYRNGVIWFDDFSPSTSHLCRSKITWDSRTNGTIHLLQLYWSFHLQFQLIVSIKIRRRIHMRKGFNEEEYGKQKFLNWMFYSLHVLETHKITDNMISARFSYFISSPSLRPCVISCSFVIHCIRPHVVLSVSLLLEKKSHPPL